MHSKKKKFPVLWIILILLIIAVVFVCIKLLWPMLQSTLGLTGRTADTAATAQPGQTNTLYIMEDGSIVSTTPTPSPSPTPTPVPTPTPTPTPVVQPDGTIVQGDGTGGESTVYPSEAIRTEIAQAALDVRPADEEYVSSPTTRYIATSSGPLNYRTGPDTTYGLVGQIEKGQSVNVYAVKDGWVLVQYNNTWGWCSTDYISETQP